MINSNSSSVPHITYIIIISGAVDEAYRKIMPSVDGFTDIFVCGYSASIVVSVK